jgi:zona occludens toxin (predicted ATPase)
MRLEHVLEQAMKVLNSWMERKMVFCLVMFLVMPIGAAETSPLLLAQTADRSQQTPTPQTTQTKPEDTAPAPVGTAAAPYVKPEGASASRPAGAAIAPAKQRRIRSFAIKAGLLIGAGVAIGVVTAASLSSPSRPH